MEGISPNGYRVLKPVELLNWGTLPVSPAIPLESNDACPACGGTLAPLAALVGASGEPTIRVGTCPRCGYTGYRDRPTAAWFARYYADMWTHRSGKDPASLRAKRQKPNHASRAIAQALGRIADRTRPIVEIGAGYGTMLRFIRERGFPNPIGIESSRHRAEAAGAATGLRVLAGDFESDAVQAELRRASPIALIASFHVLEHASRPDEIIARARELQQPGDLLAIGVPNVIGEPAMNILLFLPHLHAFTETALETLLARHGYRVIARECDGEDITFVAEQSPASVPSPPMPHGAVERALAKFRRELCLDAPPPPGVLRYAWSKREATHMSLRPRRWHDSLARAFRGAREERELLVEAISKSDAKNASPITLSFPSGLFLCVK